MVHPTEDGRVVSDYDVVVVGCGMAGLSAGIRAAERDASVAVLEKSPEEHRGGHTRFTESFRVPAADTDLERYGYEFAVPEYSKRDFYDDIMKSRTGERTPTSPAYSSRRHRKLSSGSRNSASSGTWSR